MTKSKLALAAALFAATLALGSTQAADIIPVNVDGPGEGYNDATPATPVAGNPGTTIGEQRRIVAQFAADLWGSVLQSNVPILVQAEFNPLGPSVLGSAGATTVYRDFDGAPFANTWYSSALADAIAGTELTSTPNYPDIASRFSSDFTFYYGLDGNTPVGQVNFLDVVMHEFGHGLGFQNFENEAAGTFLVGFPDVYSQFTYDNTTGKYWPQMTVTERRASALNYGNVVFTGPRATNGAGLILDDRQDFRVLSPAAVAGNYSYGTAGFGAPISPSNFQGTVVLALDPANAAGPSTTDGCSPFTNAAAVAGNIALLDRGTCGFVVKVKNAQDAGATGVIVADNAAGNPPPGLGGADPTITIPSIRVTQAAGAGFKANLPIQVAFVIDPSKLQGADDTGRPRLFMPNPVQGGSSGSHYDSNALPNLLMEPAINSTLRGYYNLDITPHLLADTGWALNSGNAKIGDCDTGIKIVDDAGLIIGANVEATSNVCLIGATSRGSYQSCMDAYKESLLASGMVTGKQAGRMMSCAAKLGK